MFLLLGSSNSGQDQENPGKRFRWSEKADRQDRLGSHAPDQQDFK